MKRILKPLIAEGAKYTLPLEEFELYRDVGGIRITEEKKKAILETAKLYENEEYPLLLAHQYMIFSRTGNRGIHDNLYFKRRDMLRAFVLAEYVEGKGEYIDRIIDGMWLIMDEATWVIPAHNHIRDKFDSTLPRCYKPEVTIVDLFSAETGALLAMAVHLLRDKLDAVSKFVADRALLEVRRRVLAPYVNYTDYNWMGYVRPNVNNWNPWITENVLLAAAVLEPSLETRRTVVTKAMSVLDNFLSYYPDDGGCDEGPSYWTAAGASCFDSLETLFDLTEGKVDVFGTPEIRAMGEYMAKANICGNYYLNFADCGPRVGLRYGMIARFGRRCGSKMLENFALGHYTPDETVDFRYHFYRELKNFGEVLSASDAEFTYPTKVFLPHLGVMIARESENPAEGLYVAMKGGHNQENHNHNDVGQFVVYSNGEPLIIDAGVGTYTANTFNENRYTIWTMRSSYHNLPTFGGVEQKDGFQYHAENLVYEEETGKLTLNLEKAYPAESDLISYRRSCVLKDGKITVSDEFALNHPTDVEFHVLLKDMPEIKGNTVLLAGGKTLTFDARLTAVLDPIEQTDNQLKNAWQRDVLYRVCFRAANVSEGTFDMVIS